MVNHLFSLNERSISVCMIQWHGHHGVMVYSKEDYVIQLPLEELANPKFQLIYMHPEICVHKKKVIGFFNFCIYQEQVWCVVVNEAHLVLNWYVLHDFLSPFALMPCSNFLIMKHSDERLELLTSTHTLLLALTHFWGHLLLGTLL